MARATLLIALLCTAALWSPAAALADGDPASDVLATQSLFVPADGGLSAGQQAQLAGTVNAAQRAGVPIRVAIVAAPGDLGSVTALWRMPQAYAGFLGVELSLVFKGTLLVVMPNGYGVVAVAAHGGPTAAALVTLRTPGAALGPASLAAVARLAAAAGHPLRASAAASPAPARAAQGSWLSSVDAGSWIALAAGMALVAAAWTASLRVRPARAPWRAKPAR